MCVYGNLELNAEYERDLLRGRFSDPSRFYRLNQYAYDRWEKTRDMRHARQWLKVMDAIKRRG